MNKKKIVVGLSGGVDSSVTACLLKEQGYEVIGVTMQIWPQDGCCEEGGGRQPVGNDSRGDAAGQADKAIEDARRVAQLLGIPHYVVDFREIFRERVIDYFVKSYRDGKTPNPCVVCNRRVKWEALMEKGAQMGAQYVATGHYARIVQLANGRYSLKQAASASKDQTYALYNLTQEQLSRTIMPLGEYTKEEVRQLAVQIGLAVADKPDSQEICFIPDKDYASFIERYTKEASKPGHYVDAGGRILGEHRGIIRYTVGQRKGLGLAVGRPVFVTGIRPRENEVVIGEAEDLMTRTVLADRINYMALEDFSQPVPVTAKIRYNHRGEQAMARVDADGRLVCIFDKPVRAATPGQSLVLYTPDGCVAAGGVILGQTEDRM